MATYVTLFHWTHQGVQSVKDTVERVQQARSLFESMGAQIGQVYWTQGEYDLIALIDAPDDQTMAAAILKLVGGGNVHSKTLRAFDEEEMKQILQKLG